MSWQTLLRRWLSQSTRPIKNRKPIRTRLGIEQLEDRTLLSVVSVTASIASANEAGPQAGAFTISRTGDTSAPLNVNYQMSGTANNGIDYSNVSGSAMIPMGQSFVMVSVMPTPDMLVEGTESAILTISASQFYTIGTGSATVNIIDNPPAMPTITISATDASASEVGPDPGTFTLTRSGSTAGSLTVSYAVSGSATNGTDYMNLPGTVVFAAGSSTAMIQLNPIADGLAEGSENVQVTIQSGAGYTVGSPSSATVSIADAPLPTVSVAATTPQAFEAGAASGLPGALTFSRTGSTAFALQVSYTVGGTASSGTDFSALSGTVMIAAGASSAVVPISPLMDAAIEPNETVVISIAASSAYAIGTNSSATVAIADNPYDAYLASVAQASQVYSSDLNSALQTYQAVIDSATVSAQSSVAVAYVAYQSAVSSGYQQFISDSDLAYSAYETALTSANAIRDTSASQALTTYDAAMAAAQSVFSVALSSAGDTYRIAFEAARDAYEAAVAPYQAAFNAANTTLLSAQSALATADAALTQGIASASAVQSAAQANAAAIYQAALNAADLNHAAAQASANQIYQAALAAADASYNAFVNPYQAARDQAYAYYQANPNDPAAQTAYNDSESALATAIATASANRNAAQATALSVQQASLSQANQDLADAQLAANQAYQAALATAAANYAATVGPLQLARDLAAISVQNAQVAWTVAQADLDNAIAQATPVRDAAIATAQLAFENTVDAADQVLTTAQETARATYLASMSVADQTWSTSESAAWSSYLADQSAAFASFTGTETAAWNSFLSTVASEQSGLASAFTNARSQYDLSASAALSQWQGTEQTAWNAYANILANNPNLAPGQRAAAPNIPAPNGQVPVLPIPQRDPGQMIAMASAVQLPRHATPIAVALAVALGVGIAVFNRLSRPLVDASIRTAVMTDISDGTFSGQANQAVNSFDWSATGRSVRTLASEGGVGDLSAQLDALTQAFRDAGFTGVTATPEATVMYFVQTPTIVPPATRRSGVCLYQVLFRARITATPPAGGAAVTVSRIIGSISGQFTDANLETRNLQ